MNTEASKESHTFITSLKNKSFPDLMYAEYIRIKSLDSKTEIEDRFMFKYYSWDKSDCSITGLTAILCWYVASIENADPYRMDEFGELVEFLNKYK